MLSARLGTIDHTFATAVFVDGWQLCAPFCRIRSESRKPHRHRHIVDCRQSREPPVPDSAAGLLAAIPRSMKAQLEMYVTPKKNLWWMADGWPGCVSDGPRTERPHFPLHRRPIRNMVTFTSRLEVFRTTRLHTHLPCLSHTGQSVEKQKRNKFVAAFFFPPFLIGISFKWHHEVSLSWVSLLRPPNCHEWKRSLFHYNWGSLRIQVKTDHQRIWHFHIYILIDGSKLKKNERGGFQTFSYYQSLISAFSYKKWHIFWQEKFCFTVLWSTDPTKPAPPVWKDNRPNNLTTSLFSTTALSGRLSKQRLVVHLRHPQN